jgi:hypothetical protein
MLDVLTEAGLYERRGEKREAIALDAPAWPELSAPYGVIPLRIVDLSTGGCCLKSPLAVPVGHRVMVHVWGESRPVASVRMRVQWQQPVGEEYLLGCAFTQRTGHKTLSSFLEPAFGDADRKNAKPRSLMRRMIFLGHAGLLIGGATSAATMA